METGVALVGFGPVLYCCHSTGNQLSVSDPTGNNRPTYAGTSPLLVENPILNQYGSELYLVHKGRN